MRRKKRTQVDWEEHDADSSDGDGGDRLNSEDDDARAEAAETAEEKRVRIAQAMLRKVASAVKPDSDDEDEDDEGGDEDGDREQQQQRRPAPRLDSVSQHLHESLLAAKGMLRRPVAMGLDASQIVRHECKQAHRLPVTCVALSEAEDVAFSASKDCSIAKYDVETGARLSKYPGRPASRRVAADSIEGHSDEVLSMALSSDGRFLVSGGRDKNIIVWDARTDRLIDTLQGHQRAVSGLVFQKGTHTLYSASHDRIIRAWDVKGLNFVESLYGHATEINGIDALHRAHAVTCGADVRFWKMETESQLVLRGGHRASIDAVKMMDETRFVTGSQCGTLGLWSTSKKRPVALAKLAHGKSWISSVACLANSDLVASGASDGALRLWCCSAAQRRFTPVGEVALKGFVNGLAFGRSGRVLVAGTGREHRLGRFETLHDAKNTLHILRLPEP